MPTGRCDRMPCRHDARAFDPTGIDGLAERDVEQMAARLTDVLTAAPEERLRMQQASLNGIIIHDIERTLDTFEALYRGEPLPS